MSFSFEGPASGQIEAVISELNAAASSRANQVLASVGEGVVTILQRAYASEVYGKSTSVFGRDNHSGQRLAAAVTLETEEDSVTVFTPQKEATYVEFGTGVFSKYGNGPITPKKGKFLAFQVFKLPSDFKGIFITKEKATGDLENGAIGVVLARAVQGMKPRPVWTHPATESAIEKLIAAVVKEAGAK